MTARAARGLGLVALALLVPWGCSRLNQRRDRVDDSGPSDSAADDSAPADDSGAADTDRDTGAGGDSDPPGDTGCPDGWERVDGDCLPSCGIAGGDTCAAAGSNLCDGLPLLSTWDCALCCDRSVYPAPGPHSFHIIDRDDPYSWDAIRTLVERDRVPLICSQDRPEDLDHDFWSQKINATWYASGEAMADAIHTALIDPATTPQVVMIDELRSDTEDLVYAAAERMRAVYPQWAGRWGAFVVNGETVSYANLNPAIDALFDAQAHVVPEFYPYQSRYCAEGGSDSARDAWLAEFIDGSSSLARLNWLLARRASRGSSSSVSVLFGVIDAYMDGTYPAWFLDRIFYVFASRSPNAWVIGAANGGPGAYKWDDPSMSNTSRDLAFAESYAHYVTAALTTSREGSVDCD